MRQMISSWVFVACMHTFCLRVTVPFSSLVLFSACHSKLSKLHKFDKNYPTQKSQLKCGKKISPKKFLKNLRIVFPPNTQGICNRIFFDSFGFVAMM